MTVDHYFLDFATFCEFKTFQKLAHIHEFIQYQKFMQQRRHYHEYMEYQKYMQRTPRNYSNYRGYNQGYQKYMQGEDTGSGRGEGWGRTWPARARSPTPLGGNKGENHSHDDEHNRHDSEYGNKGEHHSHDDEHDRRDSECGDKGEHKTETKTEKVTSECEVEGEKHEADGGDEGDEGGPRRGADEGDEGAKGAQGSLIYGDFKRFLEANALKLEAALLAGAEKLAEANKKDKKDNG